MDPKIKIAKESLALLKVIPREIDTEISGRGRFVGDLDSGCITELYFPKNKIMSPAFTRIDGEDWALMMDKLEEDGKDSEEMNVWWHSHCNMAPNPSSTDIETMQEGAASVGRGWFLGIITSNQGIKAYVCLHRPLQAIITAELVAAVKKGDDNGYHPGLALMLDEVNAPDVGEPTRLAILSRAACHINDEIKECVKRLKASVLIKDKKPVSDELSDPEFLELFRPHYNTKGDKYQKPRFGGFNDVDFVKCPYCEVLIAGYLNTCPHCFHALIT